MKGFAGLRSLHFLLYIFAWVFLAVACNSVKSPETSPINLSQTIETSTPVSPTNPIIGDDDKDATPSLERAVTPTLSPSIEPEKLSPVLTNTPVLMVQTPSSLPSEPCSRDVSAVSEWINTFQVGNIFAIGDVFFVYGASPEYDEAIQRIIRERDAVIVTNTLFDFFSNHNSLPQVIHYLEVDENICQNLYAVYGVPWANPLVQIALSQAPYLEVQPNHITIQGRSYTGENLQLFVASPNPFNHDLPTMIVTGSSEKALENTFVGAQPSRDQPANYLLTMNDFLLESGVIDWTTGSISSYQIGSVGEWESQESEHFRYYFRPNSVAQAEIAEIIKRQEEAYERIYQLIGGIDQPVKMYLYTGQRDKSLAIGSKGHGRAFPWFSSVHSLYTNQIKAIGGHETVHVISYYTLGYMYVRVLSEGLAVYLSMPGDNFKPEHEKLAALQDDDKFIPLTVLLNNAQFEQYDPQITYVEAGSFVKFLVEAYGIDKFKHLYQKANEDNVVETFEEIYGLPFEDLEENWLAVVETSINVQ